VEKGSVKKLKWCDYVDTLKVRKNESWATYCQLLVKLHQKHLITFVQEIDFDLESLVEKEITEFQPLTTTTELELVACEEEQLECDENGNLMRCNGGYWSPVGSC
jgi:hypothetical protein